MVPFFVGRQRELTRLKDALLRASAGKGGAVLVSGEAGIGKTSLAEELAKAAAWMGVPAVWGPAIEAAGAPPFWPWTQALRGLGDAGRQAEVPDFVESDSARFRFFEAVGVNLRLAAEPNGLLVVLDDLHWADAGSLRLLQVITSDLPGSRVLLVGTYRPPSGNDGGPLAEYLPALLRERAVSRLTLEGLDAADTESLLMQLVGSDRDANLVRRVREHSDGNPLYLVEVAESMQADALRGRLTLSLVDITRKRFAGASVATLDLLRIAAVVGREFDVELLAAITGLEVAKLLDSLGEAISLGLVQQLDSVTYRFAHGLLREVLYEDLPATERANRHLRVAAAIETLGDGRREALIYGWAHHLRNALPLGDQRQALDVTIRAGKAAERQLAYEQAAEEYAQAATLAAAAQDVVGHGRIQLSRARCLFRAGAVTASWQACQQAAADARASGDTHLLAEAALVVRGIEDRAISIPLFKLCEEALRTLAGADPVLEARLLGQMSSTGHQIGVGLATPGLADRAMEAARRTGDLEARFLALQAKEMELAGPVGLAARLELGDEALRLAEETRDPAVTVWVRSWRLGAFWQLGRRADLDRELEALRIAAEEAREPLGLWRLAMAQASVAAMDGRYLQALDGVSQALEIGRRGGHGDAGFMAMIVRAHIGVRTGGSEVEEAIRVSAASAAASDRLWAANVLADIGRVDEAREYWRMSGVQVSSLPRDGIWLISLHAMARVAAGVGDREAAPAIFETLLPFTDQHALVMPVGGYDGPVALNAGRLASLLERWDEAESLLRRAIAAAAAIGSPPYEAIARWELSRHLRRRGRPKDRAAATALLEQSVATARRLGMRLLDGWATADLHELDHPSGRATPLSARELEVAGLVAEGLTNRGIAQRLHLSERTAENHIKNILDKLGLGSRAQIAAWSVGGRPNLSTRLSGSTDVMNRRRS
jgi:DNA-binding CsgD family transcriptional regulator